jgi:hypothetical protein
MIVRPSGRTFVRKLKGPATVTKMTSRAIMALLILTLLASCQQLFTTSLGSALAREGYPDLSDLSLADALLYMADAKADPVLATALVAPLYNAALDADPASTTYDKAATALVDAVVISSGIGTAINDGLTAYLNEDPVDLDALIGGIAVSAASIQALTLIADNIDAVPSAPPPSMTASQAYAAAATLMVAILADDPTLNINTSTAGDFQTANTTLYDTALILFQYAESIDTPDSIFGSIFGDLPIGP